MEWIIILLCFSLLAYSLVRQITNRIKPKRVEKKRIEMPDVKKYSNYYIYLSDFEEWNNQIYEDYLEDCAKRGRIPVDKEIINKSLELRKLEYKNLTKDLK